MKINRVDSFVDSTVDECKCINGQNFEDCRQLTYYDLQAIKQHFTKLDQINAQNTMYKRLLL